MSHLSYRFLQRGKRVVVQFNLELKSDFSLVVDVIEVDKLMTNEDRQ